MRKNVIRWYYVVILASLTALLATACLPVGSSATPTTAPPTQPPTATNAPPTDVPAANILPASVYFISAVDGQVWRVARDGETATQITHEPAPVTYLDVSQADGALAYVSGNTLILADADGGNAQRLLSGPESYPEDQRINNEIVFPRFSPDGQRLAFSFAGIQILDLNDPTMTPNMLIPSDAAPDMNAGRPPAPVLFYRQAIWSPDGSQLLVNFFYWPEGDGWAVLRLNSEGALVQLSSPPEGGWLCCDPAWDAAGEYIYFASPYIGLGSPGLRRSSAATGDSVSLIAPEGTQGSEVFHMVDTARQLADGSLYYFLGQVEGFPDGSFPLLTMTRSDADAANPVALRTDSYRLEEAIWAPDASGAVVMLVEVGDTYPYNGPLVWLPADGSEAVHLPAQGWGLVWGANE